MRYRFLLAFLLYFALYLAANYPAIAHPWLYRDDLPLTETPRPNKGQMDTLKHGRPINFLLFYTYQWEAGQGWATANRLLRLLQVAVHCLNATVAAQILLCRQGQFASERGREAALRHVREVSLWDRALAIIHPNLIIYFACLLFLLYPFNGEAVLWRAALLNPAAALLSLCGVWLIMSNYRRSGVCLLMAAMLTHQQAALAGLVVWTVAITLQAVALAPRQSLWRQDGSWILAGYGAGALLSRLCIYLFLGPAGRAKLTTDWGSKIRLGLDLNRLYLLSDYYPDWLVAIHLIVVGGGFLALLVFLLRTRQLSRGLVAVAELGALFVLPFAAVLVTVENWPAWRITYLAPFSVIGAWLLIDHISLKRKVLQLLNLALLSLMLVGYWPLAQTNAAEYAQLFTQDLAQLRRIEAWAATQATTPTEIVVATAPAYLRTWNPYDLRYMHADSKVSAFLQDWTIAPMIKFFTSLTSRQADKEVREKCVEICLLPQHQQPFNLTLYPPTNTICVCP